jgi:hypothetical protein
MRAGFWWYVWMLGFCCWALTMRSSMSYSDQSLLMILCCWWLLWKRCDFEYGNHVLFFATFFRNFQPKFFYHSPMHHWIAAFTLQFSVSIPCVSWVARMCSSKHDGSDYWNSIWLWCLLWEESNALWMCVCAGPMATSLGLEFQGANRPCTETCHNSSPNFLLPVI